jgi:hypothetical protein
MVRYSGVESRSSRLKTLLPQINLVAFAYQGVSSFEIQRVDIGTDVPPGLYALVYWPRRSVQGIVAVA